MSEWTREELGKRTDAQVGQIMDRVANRVCKWRSVLAGWQLGTRAASDPESQAVRDHREATILLRAEVSALAGLLIDAGVLTARSYTEQVIVELEALDEKFARRFPGMSSSDDGIVYSLPEANETLKGWRP